MSVELSPRTIEVLEIIPEKPVENVHDLPQVMDTVAQRLHEVGLGHVVPGLLGYKSVTEEVLLGIYNDIFKDSKKMATTMPEFADLLFQAIRSHLTGGTNNLGPWSPLFNIQNSEKVLPSTAMYDFMQIHVRCDLYKALLKTDTRPDHREDYDEKINIILTKVAHQILYDYVELHPLIKRIKIPEMALKFILNEIFRARDEAWAAFELVSEGKATIAEMDRILQEIARRRMLSTNKLAGQALRQTTRIPDGYSTRAESGLLIPETAMGTSETTLPPPVLTPTSFNLPLLQPNNLDEDIN